MDHVVSVDSDRVDRAVTDRFAEPASATASATATVLDAFLEQVRRAPHAIAVFDGPTPITYHDLASAAERVRRDLKDAEVGPGSLVGISMRRTWKVVAAILGTLATGALYVPLDPEYPSPRLEFMARDSGIGAVCVDEGLGFTLADGLAVIPVTGSPAARPLDTDAARESATSGYVIYTSGSTGRPKGVTVPQGHVLELFGGALEWGFTFGPEDVWTQFHSYSFDFSVWEIWGALLYGGAMVIVADDAKRDPLRLLRLMEDHRVSVLSQVPSPFKYLETAQRLDPRPLATLRYVVFGGEAVDKPSVRGWLSRRDGPEQLVNMYGITETTVHVTATRLTHADVADDATPCPIGTALPHLDLALVRPDGSDTLVDEIGEPGEIWVAGSTLSPGYLGLPELTAQRFLTRDLGSGPRRWYRSGDLAARAPDGRLTYLGRLDAQINLRGFRVELGEIESVLRTDADVADAAAAVATLHGDEHSLVAIVVPAPGAAPSARWLREQCRRRLPAYMVPDRVVVVEAIPTAPGGGKVDRSAVAALAVRSARSVRTR